MNWNMVQTPLLLLTFVGVSACASRRVTSEQSTPSREPCAGRMVLVIGNNSGVEMEIVESRRGSGGRTVIAIVSSGGVREIPIRNDYEYDYSARAIGGRTTVAATSRYRVRDRAVTLTRVCEEGITPSNEGVG